MKIQHNISLKPFNTFGIEAFAESFVAVSSSEDILELLDNHQVDASRLFVLGGGSNILLTRDVKGTLLKNEIPGISLITEDEERIYVRVGAGVNWHSFVLYCLENNYACIENLALIPGNVGASPMQNIGAYGVELKDVFHSLEAVHIKDRKVVTFTKDECMFGYRDSVFKGRYKNQFVITSVTFSLLKNPVFHTSYGALQQELDKMNVALSIRAVAEAVMHIRRSKLPDPAVIGNAGSFFKNPTIGEQQFNELQKTYPELSGYRSGAGFKIAAGWLIEQCGWKGYRRGDAGCHARQALVLVNYDKATGDEILALSNDIIESVENKFNIKLEREVNII
jgi:UDP-N-acetylmuramate dehydrogenase